MPRLGTPGYELPLEPGKHKVISRARAHRVPVELPSEAVTAEEVGDATRFYMEVLGFRLTEQLLHLPAGPEATAAGDGRPSSWGRSRASRAWWPRIATAWTS